VLCWAGLWLGNGFNSHPCHVSHARPSCTHRTTGALPSTVFPQLHTLQAVLWWAWHAHEAARDVLLARTFQGSSGASSPHGLHHGRRFH